MLGWRKALARGQARELMLDALAAFLVRVLGAGISYAMTVIIVRSIGASEAGYFYLGMSLVAMLATLGNVGLEYAVLRFIGAAASAGEVASVQRIFRAAIDRAGRVLAALAFATAGIAMLVEHTTLAEDHITEVFAFIAPAIVFFGLGLITAYSLQAAKHTTRSVLVFSVLTPTVMVLGNLLFHLVSAMQMAVLYLVATGITLTAGMGFFRAATGALRTDTGPFQIQELFSTGRVFWAGILANQLLMSNGQLIAGLFLPSHDVTVFAVAQRTVMLISFVVVAVSFVVAPRFAALHAKQDTRALARLARLSVAISTLFSLPLLTIVLAMPNRIMDIFEHGLGGGAVLVVLAIGQLLTAICGTLGILLDMAGGEHFHRRVIVGSTMLAAVLLFILTPLLGVTGSAIAMTVGLGVQNIIQALRVCRLFDWPPFRRGVARECT